MSQHPRHICFKALVAFILAVAFVTLWFGISRAIPTSLSKLNVVRRGSESASIFHRINLREPTPRDPKELGGPTSDGPSHTEKARFKRQDDTDGDQTNVQDGETDNSSKDDDSGAKDDDDSTTKDGVDNEDDGKDEAKAPLLKVDKFKFDLSTLKGKLNDEDVTLVGKEYEPGLDSGSTKIWTRYIVAKTSTKKRIGLLRVANLQVAQTIDQGKTSVVPNAVLTEGSLAKKMGQQMHMWSDFVKLSNNKDGYAVMYRYLRGPTLKLLPEWAAEDSWKEATMLPLCRESMMKKQKEMAKHKSRLVIDKISLFSWVTDEECKNWYPLEASPHFVYYSKTLGENTIMGAHLLSETKEKKKEDEIRKYLSGVTPRVKDAFTKVRLHEAKKKLKGKSNFEAAFE